MTPENSHRSHAPTKSAYPTQSVLLKCFGRDWSVRPHFMAHEHQDETGGVFSIYTPYKQMLLRIAKEKHKQAQQEQYKAYLQSLTEHAQEHGASETYKLVQSTLEANYQYVANQSWMGKKIAGHSLSMMDTFSKGGASLPGFSVALSESAKKRAPPPLPEGASFLQRWYHHFQFVKGYTVAHNDAYKDTGIDRHFTPWWLTGVVLMGKGVMDLAPGFTYAPISKLYGQFTGNTALLFNPAKNYDTSDFLTRTMLYAGLSGAVYKQTIPRLFMATAKSGDLRVRIITVATSLITGSSYEFYCGFKAGTGYMQRVMDYFTVVEKEE
ncbi:hypothetical protein [Melittangium boletus]|uniref:hypothetical protein n=1 Tax=Melittangium boletus TaxID=83453 RepID=UPI003DA62EFA